MDRLGLALCLLSTLAHQICSIELFDANYPVIKTSPFSKGTLFGYSLAFIARHNASCFPNSNCHTVLVGAPLDSQFSDHSGAIYACSVSAYTDDCVEMQSSEILADLSAPMDVPGGKSVIDKRATWSFTDAWLGSSISTPDFHTSMQDFAVVCANQFAFLAEERILSSGSTLSNTAFYTGMCLEFDKELNLVKNDNFNARDKFDRRFPCPTVESDGSNNVGCQTGFSSDVRQVNSSDSLTKQYLFGAPITGFSYDGVPVVQEEVSYMSMPGTPDFYSRPSILFNRFSDAELGTTNFKVSYSVDFVSRSKPLMTSAASSLEDSSMQYLAGAPMFQKGAVFLEQDEAPDVKNSAATLQTLLSAAMGQGFGRSVLAIDLNGDDLSEVLVGAPDYFEQPMHGGAVYGFVHGSGATDFQEEAFFTLKGKPYSQFGFAIGSLGDVNRDGCEDFAVGAPYEQNEDSSSSGAVYIYLGSRDLNNFNSKKPEQVLLAKQFEKHSPYGIVRRFGFSFAKSRDLDANGFPDLGIGAPGEYGNGSIASSSSTSPSFSPGLVVAVRMRPLIHITASLYAFEVDSEQTELSLIDITSDSKHKCDDGSTAAAEGKEVLSCFLLQTCLTYHPSQNIPPHPDLATVYVDASVVLDSKFSAKMPRAVFASLQNRVSRNELTLKGVKLDYPSSGSASPVCQSLEKVFVIGHKTSALDNSDFFLGSSFEPLVIDMNFSLSNSQLQRGGNSQSGSSSQAPREGQLIELYAFPLLNTSVATESQAAAMSSFVIQFAKDCGKDRICLTDALLDVSFQENVLQEVADGVFTNYAYIGKEFIVNMHIKIEEEPAYEPGILIKFPSYLWYDSIHPECQYESSQGLIRCTFANKADAGDVLTKKFTFMCGEGAAEFKDNQPLKANFSFKFLTISNLTADSVLTQNLSLTVFEAADVRLSGAGAPDTVIYGGEVRGAYSIKQGSDLRAIGQMITHSYDVYNNGLSDIPTVVLQVLWPERSPNGKFLLYVTEEPVITDSQDVRYPISKFKCIYSEDFVDPLQIAPAGGSLDTESSSRKRRADDSEPLTEKHFAFQSSKLSIDCFNKKAVCSQFSCTFSDLNAKSGVKVSIKSRIWNSTFVEDYPNSVDVSSYATVTILNADYLHQEQVSNDEAKVRTRVVKDPNLITERKIPIWIIVLAVIFGLLLLLIVILICAKLGFFRRRRQVNRANNYRPPPQQTFQLGEMDDIDYRNHLEVQPVSRTNNSASGASKKKAKKGGNVQIPNQPPGVADPFTGYWGDVSEI